MMCGTLVKPEGAEGTLQTTRLHSWLLLFNPNFISYMMRAGLVGAQHTHTQSFPRASTAGEESHNHSQSQKWNIKQMALIFVRKNDKSLSVNMTILFLSHFSLSSTDLVFIAEMQERTQGSNLGLGHAIVFLPKGYIQQTRSLHKTTIVQWNCLVFVLLSFRNTWKSSPTYTYLEGSLTGK